MDSENKVVVEEKEALAVGEEDTGNPTIIPTSSKPPTLVTEALGTEKPLPKITTTSDSTTAGNDGELKTEEGPGLTSTDSSKVQQLRKTSVPDIMKDLPPIMPDKEGSRMSLEGEEGKKGKEGVKGKKEEKEKEKEEREGSVTHEATADTIAILSEGMATLSVGPANPDSFAPENEAEKLAREETAQWESEPKGKGKNTPISPPPPPPPPKDRIYLDTTPKTPLPSAPSSVAGTPPRNSPVKPGFDDSQSGKQRENESSEDEDAKSEIHSILDQFEPGHEGQPVAGANEPSPHFSNPGSPVVMSRSSSYNVMGARHPPRTSSLEAAKDMSSSPMARTQSAASSQQLSRTPSAGLPEKGSQLHGSRKTSTAGLDTQGDNPPPPPPRNSTDPVSPRTGPVAPPVNQQTLHKPPPPELDPDLPFDFHRFLEQLRHRTADPVAKYLRSFLFEFSKKQWMVHEQVKIIHDFLHFITGKMAQCEVWREVSEQEFDNAKEGMEKLVMNRLYTQTFSPAIPPMSAPPPNSRRRHHRDEIPRGRRGQHQEDVERDEVLAQKVRIYGWVREEHLDIPPVGESGRKFLTLAKHELEKIKSYRAPRDKVICVLNCCKVIFGLLRHSDGGDESADRFVPLLIYVVLRANPEHLVSNVQYILRFRNPEKLGGEAGYYLSSLMGAIQFIESLDRSSLTITDDEFERNVEAAVAAIAEKPPPPPPRPVTPAVPLPTSSSSSPAPPVDDEKRQGRQREYLDDTSSYPTRLRSVSPRPIPDLSPSSSSFNPSYNEKPPSDPDDDPTAPVAGLLRTIQKPLSTIGRIFGEATNNAVSALEITTDSSPSPSQPRHPERRGGVGGSLPQGNRAGGGARRGGLMTAEEAAARQASAEVAEAMKIQRAEHENVVGVLASMFPGLDREVISDVVVQKEGRVGLAVDACLALSSG